MDYKKYILPVSIALILIAINCTNENPHSGKCKIEIDNSIESKDLHILFIGNSHTHRNDIPGIMDSLAKSKGDSMFSIGSTPGGCDFLTHCNLEATLSAIKSENWDYVVLQESGWKGALPYEEAITKVYPYASVLNDSIKTNSPDTKVILYMTHGYKYGSSYCPDYPELCSYESMQNELKRNYTYMSQLIDAEIAPAGMLWKIIMNKKPGIELYADDDYHPIMKGSYISACVLFETIFHRDVREAWYPEGITPEDATLIQNTVSETLFECNPDWSLE